MYGYLSFINEVLNVLVIPVTQYDFDSPASKEL